MSNKLPNGEKAAISREKLLNYILSETHATGKFKAKFFRKLGFTESNIKLFEQALRTLTRSSQVKEEIVSKYGIKFVLEGNIHAPNGKVAKVVTIWIIDKNQINPRLVTIYPV